jgi:hypothetical protein
MDTLDRIAIEKTGYDNGWELSDSSSLDSVVLFSSRHPYRVNIRHGRIAFEWIVEIPKDLPISELRRDLPGELFTSMDIVCWSLEILGAFLHRAAELGIALPETPMQKYETKIQNYINNNNGIENTEKLQEVRIRIGQDCYREALMQYWKGSCAVTGIAIPQVLRASHAKPWKDCVSDNERLNVYNGLLLSANLDALFDAGLISFNNSGNIIISPKTRSGELDLLGISEKTCLRWIDKNHFSFLEWHRKNVFM